MERLAYIYKITNTKNGTIYIGQTEYEDLNKRFKEHLNPTTRVKSSNLMYVHMDEMGRENFKIEPLDTCFYRHRFIIEKYHTEKAFEQGEAIYNEIMGASHSKNTKQRLSELMKLRDKEIFKTEEFKQASKRVGEQNGMYGKTGENALNGRSVFALDENGEVKHSFVSVRETLKFLGLKGHTQLMKCCRNNTLYYGYYWKKEWNDN